MSWSRPRQWREGEIVTFSAGESGELILPPATGGVRQVEVDGQKASLVTEQFAWEAYNIAQADRALTAAHEADRGRYSEQRLGLYTLFAELPVLGERAPNDVLGAYIAWCNRWGSPGLFGFLFEVAGYHDGVWYVREKRTGALLTEDGFFDRYPEADLGEHRYREPVRVDLLSREIFLMRQVLTLCGHLNDTAHDKEGAQGAGDQEGAREGVEEKDIRDAQQALAGQLPPAVVHQLAGGSADYRQGVFAGRLHEPLDRWFAHAAGATLVPSYNARSREFETVWVFGSFMDALYHLLLEDITAGQHIRRCANEKCRKFFRPKRSGIYHDERCRRRVDMAKSKARVDEARALAGQGVTVSAIAERFGWSRHEVEKKIGRVTAASEQERSQGESTDSQGGEA